MNNVWRKVKEYQMRRRDRKGLCPRCGHDMIAGAKMGRVVKTSCPECGWVKIAVTD